MLAVKDYQIDVEIPEQTLRRYGLTLRQVGDMVRRQNIELPAGEIKAASSEYLVRGKNKRLVGDEIAELPLLTRPDGAVLRVEDLGTVRDGFTDDAAAQLDHASPPLALAATRPRRSVARRRRARPSRTRAGDHPDGPEDPERGPAGDRRRGPATTSAEAELPPGYGLVAYDDQSILVTERLETLTTERPAGAGPGVRRR